MSDIPSCLFEHERRNFRACMRAQPHPQPTNQRTNYRTSTPQLQATPDPHTTSQRPRHTWHPYPRRDKAVKPDSKQKRRRRNSVRHFAVNERTNERRTNERRQRTNERRRRTTTARNEEETQLSSSLVPSHALTISHSVDPIDLTGWEGTSEWIWD